MPPTSAPPTDAVSGVVGKGACITQALSALDAKQALERALNQEIRTIVQQGLDHGGSAVFLWGVTGLAVVTVLENAYDGRFAFFSWLQNDTTAFHDILPTIHRWAENQGCTRIAAAVERGTPQGWEKLTGYKPWKMVIVCDL